MKVQKEIENVTRVPNRYPTEPLTMEDAVIFHRNVVDRAEKARKELNKELGLGDIEEEGFTGRTNKKFSTSELKKMKLSESLFKEELEETDGWPRGVFEALQAELEDLYNLNYELESAYRGAYTDCNDVEELADYVDKLADKLSYDAELLRHNAHFLDESLNEGNNDSGVMWWRNNSNKNKIKKLVRKSYINHVVSDEDLEEYGDKIVVETLIDSIQLHSPELSKHDDWVDKAVLKDLNDYFDKHGIKIHAKLFDSTLSYFEFLLEFDESLNEDFKDPFMKDMFERVKDWYIENYPEDDLGNELYGNISFARVLKALQDEEDVYDVIGVNDSVVRERLFQRLAEILNVSYDAIYNTWLHGGNKYLIDWDNKSDSSSVWSELLGMNEDINSPKLKNQPNANLQNVKKIENEKDDKDDEYDDDIPNIAKKAWSEKDWIKEFEQAEKEGRKVNFHGYSDNEQKYINKKIEQHKKALEDPDYRTRYERKKAEQEQKQAEQKKKEQREKRKQALKKLPGDINSTLKGAGINL